MIRDLDDVFVLVVSVEGDAEEAGAVVHTARSVGWTVREAILPPFETAPIERALLDRAACVVAVWSGLAAQSPALVAAAEALAQAGKLVAVQIDHSAPPAALKRPIDIAHWRDGIDTRTRHRLLAAIQAVAGSPPTNGPPPQRTWRTLGVGVLGAVGLALAALGASLAWDTYKSRADAPGANPEAQAPARIGPQDQAAAAAAFATLDRTDPLAVQQFLARHPQGPIADQARADLLALEARAWGAVGAARDSAAVLAAITTYRSQFPDGRFGDAARQLEGVELAQVSEAVRLLDTLGHSPGDGRDAQTLARAVFAYQSSVGLGRDGLVTPDLLSALRTSVAASGRAPVEPDPSMTPGGAAPAPPPPPTPTPTPTQPRTAAAPAKTFRDCFLCPEMVVLAPGAFTMGDATGRGAADERPARTVTIAYAFALGRAEVTFEEWEACVTDGACRHRPDDMGWGRGDRPVINVSASDAEAYVRWLSAKTGHAYRLPSEAEWEYAARAGASGDFAFGADPGQACAHANLADAASPYEWRNGACLDPFGARTAPVARFKPNAFGLFDMHGNVWEWVADCWHEGYANAPSDGSAWIVGCARGDRVLRGGAFSVGLPKARVSYRYPFKDERMPFFGFRVARAAPTVAAPAPR